MAYDPQKTRNRPAPAVDRPAPVDAFLDGGAVSTGVGVTSSGETVVHTSEADVLVSPRGDDVLVATADARVEIRPESDEVIVEAAGEEIHIDTSPRSPFDPAEWEGGAVVSSPSAGRSRLVLAGAAAAVAVVAVVLWSRRRR